MAAALLPCFRSAASIYLSPEVIWRYLMTTILFWPEKFRRQYRRSPRLSIVAAPVHLVFEFARYNNSSKRTRKTARRLTPALGSRTERLHVYRTAHVSEIT